MSFEDLDDTDSEFARWLLSDDREEVVIDVDVDRVYTSDFSGRMPGGE